MTTTKNLVLLAFATVALTALAVATDADDRTTTPSEPATAMAPVSADLPRTVDPANPEGIDPANPEGAEKILVTEPPEDCDLMCLQQFGDCRRAAGGSGGPGFPGQAYDDCVNEYQWCLMEECGICI